MVFASLLFRSAHQRNRIRPFLGFFITFDFLFVCFVLKSLNIVEERDLKIYNYSNSNLPQVNKNYLNSLQNEFMRNSVPNNIQLRNTSNFGYKPLPDLSNLITEIKSTAKHDFCDFKLKHFRHNAWIIFYLNLI